MKKKNPYQARPCVRSCTVFSVRSEALHRAFKRLYPSSWVKCTHPLQNGAKTALKSFWSHSEQIISHSVESSLVRTLKHGRITHP